MDDRSLLRQFEPILYFSGKSASDGKDYTERFYPFDVESYLTRCTLWRQPKGWKSKFVKPEEVTEQWDQQAGINSGHAAPVDKGLARANVLGDLKDNRNLFLRLVAPDQKPPDQRPSGGLFCAGGCFTFVFLVFFLAAFWASKSGMAWLAWLTGIPAAIIFLLLIQIPIGAIRDKAVGTVLFSVLLTVLAAAGVFFAQRASIHWLAWLSTILGFIFGLATLGSLNELFSNKLSPPQAAAAKFVLTTLVMGSASIGVSYWLGLNGYGVITILCVLFTLSLGTQLINVMLELFSPLRDKTSDQAYALTKGSYSLPKESGGAQYVYYGRVWREPGNPEVVLQYYFFYPFNDWRRRDGFNYHEGDWEAVFIFLKQDGDTFEPTSIGISQHHLGDYRDWNAEDVEKWADLARPGEQHPIIYVAAGSHAHYFSAKETFVGSTYRPGPVQYALNFIEGFRAFFLRIPTRTAQIFDPSLGLVDPQFNDVMNKRELKERPNGRGLILAPDHYKPEKKLVGQNTIPWGAPVIVGDESPSWIKFRGLWGVKTLLKDESGPSGPQWERPWYQPKKDEQEMAGRRLYWAKPLAWKQKVLNELSKKEFDMKKVLILLVLLIPVLGVMTTTVFAARPLQTPCAVTPEFALTQLQPNDPYPGQVVTATVQVTNFEAVKACLSEINYKVRGIADADTVEKAITFEKETARISFRAPEQEASYPVQVVFMVDGAEIVTQPPLTLKVYTALSPTFERIFAGLGLFIAVMIIMSVATEVVIEIFKSFLGFKSKTTAMEALNQLKNELPGALTSLGVTADRRKEIQDLIGQMQVTIQPLDDAQAVASAIKQGNFGRAYDLLEKMKAGQLVGDAFEQSRPEAVAALQLGFDRLYESFPFFKDIAEPVRKQIETAIQTATPSTVVSLADQFKELRSKVEQNGPLFVDQAARLLNAQVDTYLQGGRKLVEEEISKKFFKPLEEIGILPQQLNQIDLQIKAGIDKVEELAHNKTAVYSESVKNLLQALELRRNDVQSPVRKFIRGLRTSTMALGWTYLITFVLVGVVTLIVGLVLRSRPDAQVDLLLLFGKSFVGWLISLAVIALATWIATSRITQDDQNIIQKGSKNWVLDKSWQCMVTVPFGYFMRYIAERFFNWLIGHDSSVTAAARYGEVDEKVQKILSNVGPTTMAGTLLQLEDLHQDQESSRIRILRVVSVVIGIYLAYQLKINATTYLDIAVPGIGAKIDAIQLYRIWSMIPQDLTVGILLTGFAASAGSKFWRDLLARLQSARDQAEEASRVVQKVQEILPTSQPR